MDQHDLTWAPVAADGSAPPPVTEPSTPAAPRLGPKRLIGSLVLAAGLLGIGGASVALAASPAPTSSGAPSAQQPSGGPGAGGAMPGGCTHMNGGTGSSGSTGSGSSSSSG